jgi:hypothetical protein
MAKPICVVYYEPKVLSRTGNDVSVSEMNKHLGYKFDDYHVLAIPFDNSDGEKEDLYLQVFHEKDFTEIQHTELKELIIAALPKQEAAI